MAARPLLWVGRMNTIARTLTLALFVSVAAPAAAQTKRDEIDRAPKHKIEKDNCGLPNAGGRKPEAEPLCKAGRAC